jgi:hypothetical protein
MTSPNRPAAERVAQRVTEQTKANAEYATQQAQANADRASQQIHELGERATEAGRTFGGIALNVYEEAAKGLVEFEQRAADAAPVDWVKAAIGAHASFVRDINAAYVKAAREILA